MMSLASSLDTLTRFFFFFFLFFFLFLLSEMDKTYFSGVVSVKSPHTYLIQTDVSLFASLPLSLSLSSSDVVTYHGLESIISETYH
jgi:hypothetical protein